MIRPLDRSDVPALAPRLVALPLLQRYGRTAASLARDLEAGLATGDGLVVADDATGPAGLAWFDLAGSLGRAGYLRLLAVAPGCERAGTGALLLDAFERAVAARSRHASLLVSDFNVAAQRFYARHGYHHVGTLSRLVLPDVDELLYWKRLT
jgi:ribosomal protein S18 acetylase RimI-like enzyme